MGSFSTRKEYIRHMQEAHSTKLSDTQLRVLAKKNTRKAVRLFSSCPMCAKDAAKVNGPMEDHIAEHLKSLALKSLLSYQDEISNDAGGEKDSIGASQLQSRSTASNLIDDKDILKSGTAHVGAIPKDIYDFLRQHATGKKTLNTTLELSGNGKEMMKLQLDRRGDRITSTEGSIASRRQPSSSMTSVSLGYISPLL
jgi:hypothetical protein